MPDPTPAPPSPLNLGPQPQTPDMVQQPPSSTPVLKQRDRSNSPNLLRFIQDMVSPQFQAQPGQMARPVSRVDGLERFLGNFLYSLGQGMQAAHGPGAAAKGFGAAATAPVGLGMQQAQLQSQIGLQGAETEQKQAETQLQQAQAGQVGKTAILNIPGMGPTQVPISQLGSVLKGAGAAGISGEYKITAEQMKLLAATGQVGSVQTDAEGNKVAYNKYGKPLGKLDGAVDPRTFLKSSSTVEYKEDENGNIIALPKTTTSGVVLPGKTGASPPSGFPQAGGGTPRVVARGKIPAMVQGNTATGGVIAGTPAELRAAGASGITKMEAGDVSKVTTARQLTGPNGLFDLINQDLSRFKPGELGVINSRANEFLAGKVGTGDDRFMNLRTHVGLLKTALMQAHVGSKGGEGFMEEFGKLADSGKMDQDTLASAIAAEKKYVSEKAMRPSGFPQSPAKSGGKALDPISIR